MKLRTLVLSLTLLISLPALAQRPGAKSQHGRLPPQANQRQVPSPPHARNHRDTSPQFERRPNGSINRTPHYSDGHWYGHARPNDPRYSLQHPFDHGRFLNVGPRWQYNIVRFDRGLRRFWLPGGFYFQIALWDWPYCSNWCWICGNDFILYDDPDHLGWYLLYNLRTGVYVHVLYMGP